MKNRTENSIKPFWSWNDKLDKAELEQQIEQMKHNGIEGFFMHARGGLKTEYMSEEWFCMVEACLNKADELGMQAWAYDENGWPSGSADGIVPSNSAEYQQKYLHFLEFNGNNLPENIIACFEKINNRFIRVEVPKKGNLIFYLEINPYYIDVFNKDAIGCFLKNTHEVYYKHFKDRFGASLKGFFTDEPQFGNWIWMKAPWSHVFPEEFKRAYGYDILDNLPCLFYETEGYEAVRNDFHTLVSKLFSVSFIKQMYDWCTEHNCKLTGHMIAEDSIASQMRSTNGVMPCYEYFHEPGIDWLGRAVASPVIPKQLGSVARQLNRKTMTETFALCGWDVSLNELKWIAQWQYLNGVTSLCPHLESYSIRGERKRDYPASLFTQLPWFSYAYSDFADYFTSLGTLLDNANDIAPLLVVHPMHSAYILHNCDMNGTMDKYSQDFDNLAMALNGEHILHHYGDEAIMAKYGSTDGKTLKIGNCEYNAVLLPSVINLTFCTVSLLLQFAENGGKIYALGDLPRLENGRPSNRLSQLNSYIKAVKDISELKEKEPYVAPVSVKSNHRLDLTLKEISDGEKLLYVINSNKEIVSACFELDGGYAVYSLDLLKEKEERLTSRIKNGKTGFSLDFAEYGSAVIRIKNCSEGYFAQKLNTEYIKLKKEFKVASCTDNALTLDKCTYRIDGGEWQPEIAVINLQAKALSLQKACNIEMRFNFNIAQQFDFSTAYLCMEDYGKFEIKINGQKFFFRDEGMYIDRSIRKSNIGRLLRLGINTVELSCRFTQSRELYYAKSTPDIHESVLNKLTYDTELESIYIIGDFGVEMAENYTLGERRCIHGGKTFSLAAPVRNVDITDITHQGFWFFSGEMTLSQKVSLTKKENTVYKIAFKHLNAPAAEIYINGIRAGIMAFSPFELDITDLIKSGENSITVLLLSGNRNLLGPHHKPMGESYFVGPTTFTDRCSWPDDPNLPQWTDNYNFVLFGAELFKS